jgi:predicted ferric reductase
MVAPSPSSAAQFAESSLNVVSFLSLMFAITLGMLAALLVMPAWLPNVAFSMAGEAPKFYWYLARGTAFISLTLLWISMVLGIGLSNKMARIWPGAPASFAIHEYVSLLGLAFAAFHALVLLGDRYIGFTLRQVLVPFATTGYRPVWVGLGQLGFYVWAIVAWTFYIRRAIGQRTWRMVHYASFIMYLMALGHGLFGGTDGDMPWVQYYYWLSGGSVLFLVFTRIVDSLIQRGSSRQKAPSPAAQ